VQKRRKRARGAGGDAKWVSASGGSQGSPALPYALGFAGFLGIGEIGVGGVFEGAKLIRNGVFEFGERVLRTRPGASLSKSRLVSRRSEQLGYAIFIGAG
jgi:hypothetical protein